MEFGASGLLRGRIEADHRADLFLSADMAHPRALLKSGLAVTVAPLLTNRLCLLTRRELATGVSDPASLLLDPSLSVGMSTPGNDPSGDYALELFRRIETTRTGAFAALVEKALRLTGAPGLPPAPAGRNIYGWLMETEKADIFVTYRTNATRAMAEVEGLAIIDLPAPLAVDAHYGLAQLAGAGPSAKAFHSYLSSAEATAHFNRFGFIGIKGEQA